MPNGSTSYHFRKADEFKTLLMTFYVLYHYFSCVSLRQNMGFLELPRRRLPLKKTVK
jgi:hypothetical protein